MRYRVYWEDTDAGGVVYHARYLHFFERARSDWLRELGFPQQALRTDDNRVFAVTRMDTRFIAPARLEDELEVTVRVERTRAVSVVFSQAIHRVADGELLATAEVHAACLNAETFKPARPPRVMAAAIERFQQQQHEHDAMPQEPSG
ncbi:MAG: tol-pal system-associated acyl-CoA thioesterase [Pseudomonadota bacterium]